MHPHSVTNTEEFFFLLLFCLKLNKRKGRLKVRYQPKSSNTWNLSQREANLVLTVSLQVSTSAHPHFDEKIAAKHISFRLIVCDITQFLPSGYCHLAGEQSAPLLTGITGGRYLHLTNAPPNHAVLLRKAKLPN